MDTNDLTDMAYACIGLADEAVDVLKSEIGAGCSHYSSEDAYLKGVLAYIRDIEDEPAGGLSGFLVHA
jgi:hypothetical protein